MYIELWPHAHAHQILFHHTSAAFLDSSKIVSVLADLTKHYCFAQENHEFLAIADK